MLRPDLRSGCRCAKARPKVWQWFSSGLAVVCAGMLSVIYAGVLRPNQAVGVLRPDLRSGCRCAKARPKVWQWFRSGLAVVCAGVLTLKA